MVIENNGVRKETVKSAITLDKISKSENQKEGTLTAQIRQVITTVSQYPSKKVDSNMQDSLFGASDFGFSMNEFTSTENRVGFVPVPSHATESQVKEMLDKAFKAGATLYKVLSNEPILDDNQKWAIANTDQTLDAYAEKQAVRYPKDAQDKAGKDVSNQLILDDKGNVQYKRIFFSQTPKEDIDNRDSAKTYVSASLAAEMMGASTFVGQVL